MTTTEHPHTTGAPHHHAHPSTGEAAARTSPRGVQSVKFTFFRVTDDVRRGPAEDRAALGRTLETALHASAGTMLTRVYSTVGTRVDAEFLVWQAHDDLRPITDWHASILRSPLAGRIAVTHSFLSMTMRSLYTNDLHAGAETRTRLRTDGGVDEYLFVYPMAKTREWYTLPTEERQRMMNEHIAIGHRYHGIKINTTYSYGLDDQEFVVAFEGNDAGEFLALVRELRDSDASRYTLFDTPMFTCRRLEIDEVAAHLGLAAG